MDLTELTGDERIIAEHAVLAYQAVRQATRDAKHGQGMAVAEAAVTARGLETLRKMFELSVSEQPEAQKRGLQQSLFVRKHDELPGFFAQDLRHQPGRRDYRPTLLRFARV